jgi:hypothetical protein
MLSRRIIMSTHVIIGPYDRIIRVMIGFLVLVVTYALHLSSNLFAIMHILSVYLWITTMIVWDPVYAAVFKIMDIYREYKLMRGDF